jgi:lipopolysaccharide transport system ATP-binding protein
MNSSIITIKNLSKKYSINHQRGKYVTLRDILTNIFKNPFKFLKHKAKVVAGIEKKEEFWALKDINLELKKGEVLGIIGSNGAGKSTLLKILSQITPPTTGEVKIHGRVGSLLEVGTGFHPELTGRENIFLNAAILGMTRKEITKKFDQIVEFAGIEKFLDTPVKHYSSGMYVRLAFSVAAHMEPDILIIDEVLAVGDAEFQKKCLSKMDEVTKTESRTILFVSHNMGAIEKLCKNTIWLNNGQIEMIGKTSTVIEKYLLSVGSFDQIPLKNRTDRKGTGQIKTTNIEFRDAIGEKTRAFTSGQDAQIWVDYEAPDPSITEFDFYISIDSLLDQTRIATLGTKYLGGKITVNPNEQTIKIKMKRLPFNVGEYQFTIFIRQKGQILDWIQKAGTFSVSYGDFYRSNEIPEQNQGHILLDYTVQTDDHS